MVDPKFPWALKFAYVNRCWFLSRLGHDVVEHSNHDRWAPVSSVSTGNGDWCSSIRSRYCTFLIEQLLECTGNRFKVQKSWLKPTCTIIGSVPVLRLPPWTQMSPPSKDLEKLTICMSHNKHNCRNLLMYNHQHGTKSVYWNLKSENTVRMIFVWIS